MRDSGTVLYCALHMYVESTYIHTYLTAEAGRYRRYQRAEQRVGVGWGGVGCVGIRDPIPRMYPLVHLHDGGTNNVQYCAYIHMYY